ncbi:uncharacterized protein [Porites lutea]|uniref:uncharacterized protein isoform X1 n=1 Tax=Porites lutea TaxID=51062 RepID=UPI003CC683D2
MDKFVSLLIFAAFLGLTCSFPSKEQDARENEWMRETAKQIDSEDDDLETRSKVLCPELGLLEHYHVNLGASHIPCSQVTRKRAANLIQEFKKRELEYERSEIERRGAACCSPGCDWLLGYLEIDSSVVKCLDRK